MLTVAYINFTADGQRDGQTDGRTTYDSNTALALANLYSPTTNGNSRKKKNNSTRLSTYLVIFSF